MSGLELILAVALACLFAHCLKITFDVKDLKDQCKWMKQDITRYSVLDLKLEALCTYLQVYYKQNYPGGRFECMKFEVCSKCGQLTEFVTKGKKCSK